MAAEDGMARREILAGAAGVTALLGAATAVKGEAFSREDTTIIAVAQALEEAEQAKDPDGWANLVAEDYTELNSHYAMILKGRETGRQIQDFARQTPHRIVGSYMSNPDIQIFGDAAILCYVSMRAVADREGRADPACRRVTRVFERTDGVWKLVHTHFSAFDYVSTY